MYKVFANRLPIILTSDKNYLDNPNTYLLSSISIEEIIKKLKIQKEIFIYSPNKDDILNEFKIKIDTIKAAGGIVRNKHNELLFIFRKGKWDLPKGKAEKNENISQTALREVIEETGIKNLSIVKPLEKTYHIFKRRNNHYLKSTYWFEMYSDYTGKFKPQKKEGISRVEWIGIENLESVLPKSYANVRLLFG